MIDVTGSMKDRLSRQATVHLQRLGYSSGRVTDAKREARSWLQARAGALARRTGVVAGHGVVWLMPSRIELLPVEAPLAGPGEVTIAVTASAVSVGTERAWYLGLPNARVRTPFQPGYSAGGRVIAAGRDAAGLRPGDAVVVTGVPHQSVATAPAARVHRVPEGVAIEDAALVQLGVIAGQGVRKAGLAPEEPFAVFGMGIVGALAQRLASAQGAGEATAVTTSRRKQRVADAGKATLLTTADDRGRIEALGVPVVIEASGDPTALELAVAAAAPGGRIVLLGSPRGLASQLPVAAIRRKRLRVIGAHVVTLDTEAARSGEDAVGREARAFLDVLATGRLEVADLVDTVVDPREAALFYRRLASDSDLVGARFDWTALPPGQRVRRARLLRLPDVRGRGVELDQRPLPPGGSRSVLGDRAATRPVLAPQSPFARASGHLRFGMIGCGEIALQNAAAVAAAPNATLTACFDTAPALAADLARTHEAAVARSAGELLARDDVDAVFLSVPHHLHAPLAIEAARAGKHVVVEKPPANNLAEAARMVRAAKAAGVTLSVCFPHRYQSNVAALRRLLAAGAIGELGGVTVTFFAEKAPSYRLGGNSGRSMSTWRTSRAQAGGGVLIMNVSHYLDLTRHLAGVEVESVSAVTTSEDRCAEVEDSVAVTVRYANGAVGSIIGSTVARGAVYHQQVRLWGRDGHVQVEPQAQLFSLRALEGFRPCRWQTLGPLPEVPIRAVYVSRFVSAVCEGREAEVSAADGLAAQALIEAVYRSAETGAAVRPSDLLAEAGA